MLADDQPEVRVRLDTTGVYVIPYEPLAANGYPAHVPIAQVSVHRHEFLEGAQVPYETIDIPCEVDDVNNNGEFDAGDRIWLYARNWAERSGASRPQRFWGDAEMVFVTVAPGGGARVPQRSGWRGTPGLTPLASYPYTQHWEESSVNIMPFVTVPQDTSLDLYHWTDITLWNDRPDSITYGINSIDTTHTIDFKIGWMGRASNTHYIYAAVENPALPSGNQLTTVAENVYWYGREEQITDAVIHGSALREGTNHFVDWGKTDPGPYDPVNNYKANVSLNWFEATYWRRFTAIHDRLTFNTAGAAGEIQIHADYFFTDTTHIYDVTDPDHPVRVVLDATHANGGTFDLQDSVATGVTHYYAAGGLQDPIDPNYGPMQPPAGAYSVVTRRPIYANTSGDYLLVVPEAFLNQVAPLIALRQGQGLSVVVATCEQLYDEFNGGRHSAAAIQRFAKYAYANWSSRFLLLVGDGTLDPLDHFGKAGTDWVPIWPVPGPVPVDGFEVVPSDNAYGIVTGNADPINSNVPVIPEIMVGRLPGNSTTDVQAMVSKIVNYENLAGDQSWRSHVMLVSDDAYSSDAGIGVGPGGNSYCWKSQEEFFVGLNRKVASVIVNEAGLSQMNVEPFDLRAYVTNPNYYIVNGPNDTCRVARSTIQTYVNRTVTPILFSHTNDGTLWSNFQGHANEYVLTHEDLYLNNGDYPGSDNRYLFANSGKPIIWTAFSCHANMFARPEGGPGQFGLGGCIGEDMVTLPDNGAVATWASVCYEIVPRDDSTHLNVALARAMFADPPSDPQLSGGSRVVLGEAIQAAFTRFIPTVSDYYIYERGTPITYTLLGDPAQRMWIGQPQIGVRANDSLVVDGVPVRLHTPGDTLTLVANIASTVRIDSLGLFLNEGSGDVAVALQPGDIVPAFPDTANGGVYGGRRFVLTYHTSLKTETYHYRIHTRDANGLNKDFIVAFEFDANLAAEHVPIRDGDYVASTGNVEVVLLSPAPLDPNATVTLTVNGAAQPFTASPNPGDASGREWRLSWSHTPYAAGLYTVVITTQGGPTITHTFNVNNQASIDDAFVFPNPFDNDGTNFSFILRGAEPTFDVRITIFTISGHRIWSQDYPGLTLGYHQIPWNGNDAEGSALANGTYFYRISASSPGGKHIDKLGRMVKLRKPRHVDVTATTP
jgi:hypothetical protein